MNEAEMDANIARWDGMQGRILKLEAMLRLAWDDMPSDGLAYSGVDYEMWMDGLRERVQKGGDE